MDFYVKMAHKSKNMINIRFGNCLQHWFMARSVWENGLKAGLHSMIFVHNRLRVVVNKQCVGPKSQIAMWEVENGLPQQLEMVDTRNADLIFQQECGVNQQT